MKLPADHENCRRLCILVVRPSVVMQKIVILIGSMAVIKKYFQDITV